MSLFVLATLGCVRTGVAQRAILVEQYGGCDAVAATVASATPVDSNSFRPTPYGLIQECPAHRDAAWAAALRSSRQTAGDATLRAIFGHARNYRSEEVAHAALDVVRDRQATDQARGWAIALILHYILPDSWPAVAEMGRPTDRAGAAREYCQVSISSSHRTPITGIALPDQLIAEALQSFVQIFLDPSESLFLRNVAACWDGRGITS